MRYRQIEAFRFVMITGTTVGAAEALGVTQPAVSRLLADLELALGFRLFERIKGRLLPTPEAVRFYQGVSHFFVGMESLDRVAEQIRSKVEADLKVCGTPALSTYAFPKAVEAFRCRFPEVYLTIETLSSSEIVERLQSHMAHLAVTLAFPDLAGVVQEQVAEAAHVCAVHRSHRLAEREVVTADDFQDETILSILPSGLVNWNSVQQALTKAERPPRQTIGIQNSHTGYSLVAANQAIALIEPFAAATWTNNEVVILPFRPAVKFRYVLAYPTLLQRTETIRAFASSVRQRFEAEFGK